jgi:hypothetical protein
LNITDATTGKKGDETRRITTEREEASLQRKKDGFLLLLLSDAKPLHNNAKTAAHNSQIQSGKRFEMFVRMMYVDEGMHPWRQKRFKEHRREKKKERAKTEKIKGAKETFAMQITKKVQSEA